LIQIDFFAAIGIVLMTSLFLLQFTMILYNFKLYRLGRYKDLWKYWKYGLIGFLCVMGGVAGAFYFYVLYIFSRPTLALRVSADPIHLLFIYIGALVGTVGSFFSVLGMKVFYNNAEKISKTEND